MLRAISRWSARQPGVTMLRARVQRHPGMEALRAPTGAAPADGARPGGRGPDPHRDPPEASLR